MQMKSRAQPSQMPRPQRHQCLRIAARYVPVSLLVIVAVTQMYLSAGQHLLAPSKGGGFGMFATVDTLKTRLLRVFVIDAAGRARPIRLDARTWGQTLRHTRALPTRRQLRYIARHVANAYPRMQAVRVSVWKRSFNGSSRQVALLTVQELLWEHRRDAQP